MRTIKYFIFILALFISGSIYSDTQKLLIEYEFVPKSGNKMTIRLYKDGERFKLIRKLSDSPNETGTVTTYIDVAGNSVISVTEKDGKKKALKSAWDDDYTGLVVSNKILFRGIPKGKSEKTYTKGAGSHTVNGRDCTTYDSGLSFLGASTKYYMWNDDIMLKSEAADNTVTAVTVDEDPIFSADEFTVPADVEY